MEEAEKGRGNPCRGMPILRIMMINGKQAIGKRLRVKNKEGKRGGESEEWMGKGGEGKRRK